MYPVEYKKGHLGNWTNDALQLCAQALCLEEALSEARGATVHIPRDISTMPAWATQSGAAHTRNCAP